MATAEIFEIKDRAEVMGRTRTDACEQFNDYRWVILYEIKKRRRQYNAATLLMIF